MVIYRLLIWFFMSNLAFKELWNWLRAEKSGKQGSGQARFLVIWTCTSECLVSVKFLKDAGNIQYVETPEYIWVPWVLLLSAMGLYYVYLRVFRCQKIAIEGKKK